MTAVTTRPPAGPDLVATLADVVEREAPVSEAARTLSAPTVDALWDCGLMQHFNPAAADTPGPVGVKRRS